MNDLRAQLILDTDRCVKCALCLPVCPTYTLTHDEAQSPRGRVALMQGLAMDALSASDVAPHIDGCLSCRACEKVCPAQVPYGAIADRGRALMEAQQPRRQDRLLARLLGMPRALAALAGLSRIAAAVPGLRRRLRLLAMAGRPARRRPAPAAPVSPAPVRGTVSILRGCVSAAFDPEAGHAIAFLLTACGYRVRWIDGCCGALSQHSGDLPVARRRARLIGAQVTAQAPDAVVHPASGCAAAVHDFAQWSQDAGARAAAALTVDVFGLLAQGGLKQLLSSVAIPPMTVAVHIPCTQRNVLDGATALGQLLATLDGLTTVPLAGHGCCGAAGSHMLSHRTSARALGAALLADLPGAARVDALLSANIGCAWHLRDLLRTRTQDLPVIHPAVLLAGALDPQRFGRAHN